MIDVFYLLPFISLMIMKSEINKLICILFVHLSSIIPENLKDLALIILEILDFIELHIYEIVLVYFEYTD